MIFFLRDGVLGLNILLVVLHISIKLENYEARLEKIYPQAPPKRSRFCSPEELENNWSGVQSAMQPQGFPVVDRSLMEDFVQ